ncbi:MAG: hypothetical protein RSC66_03155, partial [Comamonas sp.]
PDDGFYEKELRNFLISLGQVYSIMLIVAFVLAYFLSRAGDHGRSPALIEAARQTRRRAGDSPPARPWV